jgi:hypothetical protein
MVITTSGNIRCQHGDHSRFRWSGVGSGSVAGQYESGNRCCQCHLILDIGCACRWSAASILDSLAVTVAALVVLTGRLPAHTQPGGDLWPPDAQTNSLVNQLGECRFCPPLCNPVALDLLQHLGGSHPGSRLHLAWRPRWRPLPPPRLHPLGSPLCSSHAIQDAGDV